MFDILKSIPFVGDMISDIAGFQHAEEQQEDSQRFNADEAGIQREFNSAQAIAQRDWTERMSNTQYQRAVADMKAAGLNPMLAYHQGGAGFPGGAGATGSAASSSPVAAHPRANVSAAMQTASQIQLNDAQAKRLEAETDEIRERTKNYDPQRREIEARIPTHTEAVNKMQQEIAESSVRIERIWAEAKHLGSSAAHLDQQIVNLKESIPHIRAQIKNLEALTAQSSAATAEIKQRVKENLPELRRILDTLESKARQAGLPGKVNEQAAQESFTGLLGAYLRSINPLNQLLNQVPR